MTQAEYGILQDVLELCQTLFQTVTIFVLWRMVFRTKKEKSAIIAAVLFTIISIVTKLLFTAWWFRYAAFLVFAEIYCLIRYRKHYEKAIFVLLLYYNFHSLSALISDSLWQKIQNMLYQNMQNSLNEKLRNAAMADLEQILGSYLYQSTMKTAVNSVIVIMAYTCVMIFMVYVLSRILKNADVMTWRDTVMFSVQSLSVCILVSIVSDLYAVEVGNAVFYFYDTKKEMIWKMPLVAGCIFIGEILLIYFWQNYRKLLEERQKHFMEKQQIRAIRQRLEEAEDFYGNVRKVRHEMKNHMTNIKGLAAGEQYGEIADYVRKIDETMQELEYKYVTGNAVTDVVLNDKWHRAEKLGTRFEADVQYAAGISAFDMGMILSNLLDNAIEACEKIEQEERFICIATKRKKQFLLIDVENSFDGTVNLQDNGQLPLTTKESDTPDILKEHGIGLKNVSDIAERYDGGVRIRVRERVFHVTVMLQQR